MNWLSLKNNRLKFKTPEKTTDNFIRIYGIYLEFVKEIPRDHNMSLIGLGNTRILTYDQGEPAISYKWTGWSSRLQENCRLFRGIYRIYPNVIKESRRMSTCNRLVLQTLGSQPVVPKNLTDHCVLTDYAQKSPTDTWVKLLRFQKVESWWMPTSN